MSASHPMAASVSLQLPERPPASLLAPPGMNMPALEARDPSPLMMPREDLSGAQRPLAPPSQATSLRTPPGSLATALEDISPPPTVLGSSIGEFKEPEPSQDPFESSALQGFGLASVGSALSVHLAADGPTTKEASLWAMVHMGGKGKDHPYYLPWDKTARLSPETAIFAPPKWPSSLPVALKAAEEDKLLREWQAQWGMAGLAIAQGIIWQPWKWQRSSPCWLWRA